MKVLTFTTLFPNRAEPGRGIFVKERVRHFQDFAQVKVVAPVGVSTKAKLGLNKNIIPTREEIASLDVRHPLFFYVPGLFKPIDGFLLFFSSIISLWKIRKEFPFDMIDAHYGFPDGFAAVLLGKVFRVPVSITLRGSDITMLPTFRLRRWFLKYGLRKADTLIAVSGTLKKKAMEVIGGTSRIHVIMNSVDHTVFQPMGKALSREKMGIEFDGQIILSVGVNARNKGFQYLIEAAAPIVKDPGKNIRIYIVGRSGVEKGYDSDLRNLVRELDLEGRIVFWGPSSHEKMTYLYNAADLFCLFSEREGCPNVLMEAIACGLPSVVCGDWADREMIPSDDIGYIAGSREKSELEKVIRKALGSRWDREKIRNFSLENSWKKVSEKTLELYQGMAG